MNTKSIIKFLLIGIVIAAMLLLGTTSAQLKEYASDDKSVIMSIDNIGIDGKNKVKTKTEYRGYNDAKTIYSVLYITEVNQEKLNVYAQNEKELNTTTKIKISNNATKAELNGEKIEIENINGNKYAVINETLKYTNTTGELEPSTNKDVEYINFSNVIKEETEYGEYYGQKNQKLKIYTTETSYEEYYVENKIRIQSVNEPYNYHMRYVNKYGKEYSYGGMGGGDWIDKMYLEYEPWGELSGIYWIPKNSSLKDVYLELTINVKQGDTIEIKDVGTLYYAGMKKEKSWDEMNNQYEEIYYIYKNSLDKVKNYDEPKCFTAKTKSGYDLIRYIYQNYTLDENSYEEEVTGDINTGTTNGKMNMLFSGNGNAKFESIEISKTDTLYKKIENGLKEANDLNWENVVSIWAYDLYVTEGEYEGPLNITFNVGKDANGKEYVVGHLKHGVELEYFTGIVKDGKITITVDELSPFVIGVKEDYLLGDVDENGKIDAQDAVMILKYVAHNIELDEKQLLAANTTKDEDGTVDAQDAVQILKLVAHNINEF